MDEELLIIAGTLAEHRLNFHCTKIHTCYDHKNLTHVSIAHSKAREKCHRLFLEKFWYVVLHIPGDKNELDDSL